jgi:NRPS condensation-like uncharacterized protein
MAELTQVFDAEAIRAAVLNTMKKHPILRSYVQMDDAGLSYLHITDCSEPEISEEPLPSNEDWSEIVMREQKKPFTLGRAPLFRLTCLQGGIGTVLIICIHHILADGKSGLHILREIAYFLNNPGREAEAVWDHLLEDSALYPGERLFFPIQLLIGWLNIQWRKSPHIFSTCEYITMRNNYWKQKSHTLLAASLDHNRTDMLLRACRENGVTVNTLLMTTFLKCVQEIEGPGKGSKKVGMAISIHPNDTGIGNFASAMSVVHMYNEGKTVWENTCNLQRQVTKKLGREKRKLFYLIFLKAANPNLLDSMYFSLFAGFKNRASETLSRLLGYVADPAGGGITNLGKSGLTTFEDGIKSLYFIPPLVPSMSKIVGAVTTDSGLHLACQYDNRCAELSRRVFDKWINLLRAI